MDDIEHTADLLQVAGRCSYAVGADPYLPLDSNRRRAAASFKRHLAEARVSDEHEHIVAVLVSAA